ncbi:MAG: hypothetical protein Q9181_000599 [Wetmoreana brouardii]
MGPLPVLLSRNVRAAQRTVRSGSKIRSASLVTGYSPWAGLRIQQDRLMDNIHTTCEWGKGAQWGSRGKHETGMSRLALSDADKQARDWFVHTTMSLGCQISIDAMGNIFAVRPGRRRAFPPTCAGSHLDTQPTGGRYDGILGVCAGVEILRVLHEEKIETEFPVAVIDWTNEEGARFPISMVASGVWAGEIPLERAHNLKEVGADGRTMKQELERIGYLGAMDAKCQAMPLGWHTITVKGQDCHTGTTDFANRADALLTAAKLILHSRRLAVQYNALASSGIIKAAPGSTNTVPGWVQFSLDIRAPNDDILMKVEENLKSDFDQIGKGAPVDGLQGEEISGRPCTVEWTLDAISNATKFDSGCVDCVRQSAEDLFGEDSASLVQDMISGAGKGSLEKEVFGGLITVLDRPR